jgi:hypothetical protein
MDWDLYRLRMASLNATQGERLELGSDIVDSRIQIKDAGFISSRVISRPFKKMLILVLTLEVGTGYLWSQLYLALRKYGRNVVGGSASTA